MYYPCLAHEKLRKLNGNSSIYVCTYVEYEEHKTFSRALAVGMLTKRLPCKYLAVALAPLCT